MIETLPVDRLAEARALRIELHRHHSAIAVPPGYVPRDEDAAYLAWRSKIEPLLRERTAELFVHRSDGQPDGLRFYRRQGARPAFLQLMHPL